MINENKEIILPEETPEIIFNLLKKYKLEKNQKEVEEKIAKAETIEEIRKMALIQPSIQIIVTVKEVIRGEIPAEKLGLLLQERLKITEEDAEKLSEDLKKDIINLTEVQPSKTFEKNLTFKKKLIKENLTPQKKQVASKETNTYREPIS